MATYAFQQITDKQRISGGQVAFKIKGSNKYVSLGSCPTVEFTPNLTEVESYSAEFGDRRLIGSWAVGKDGTINITCESWTEILHQALFMSEKKYLTQTAVTAGTMTLEDVAVGDIFRIEGLNPEITEITDDATGVLVEDEHYTVHRTGFVEIIALPAGFGENAIVEYTLPAITEAEKLLDLGIMATSGVRGELVIIGVVADGMPGQEVEQTYWDVELRPSGAVPSINTEALNQATLTGRVFATSGKGNGKSYGQMRTIPKAA